MIRRPVTLIARSRRARAVLAGLVLCASGAGAGMHGGAAHAASVQITNTYPLFWDVGISPDTSRVVDGQELHVFSAAGEVPGGLVVLECSGPFGGPGVICQQVAGPVPVTGNGFGTRFPAKAVITDGATGQVVDCRWYNDCTIVIHPAGQPDRFYAQPVTFSGSPSVAPPGGPPTPSGNPGAPAPPTTAAPGRGPRPVTAMPRFTG